jgi:hypothetical protein
VTNIQGDFIYLSPPCDLANISDSLNTNTNVTDSTFTNVGYHGLTVESANGLIVNHDVFNGMGTDAMGTDAMDFEYDDYSTPFNPDGTPFWAAQDNVTIENSTWTNWSGDWFASDQGQTPGIQQQTVTLTGNTLYNDAPLFQIVGTFAPTTTAPYLNNYLTITDNKFAPGYYAEPYRGGTSVASSIYNVSNLFMEDNALPLCAGTYEAPQPASAFSTPDEYELDLYGITNGAVVENNFAGSLGILQPQNYDTQCVGMIQCGNNYGIIAGRHLRPGDELTGASEIVAPWSGVHDGGHCQVDRGQRVRERTPIAAVAGISAVVAQDELFIGGNFVGVCEVGVAAPVVLRW